MHPLRQQIGHRVLASLGAEGQDERKPQGMPRVPRSAETRGAPPEGSSRLHRACTAPPQHVASALATLLTCRQSLRRRGQSQRIITAAD